jgi:hypothetical protein
VLGIAAVVALPVTAFIMENDYHSLDDEGCALAPTEVYSGRDGRAVQIEIQNSADTAQLRVCVTEDGVTERHEGSIEFASDGVYSLRLVVAPQTKRLSLEMDRPGYELTAPVYMFSGAGWELPVCQSGIAQLKADIGFTDYSSESVGQKATCGPA